MSSIFKKTLGYGASGAANVEVTLGTTTINGGTITGDDTMRVHVEVGGQPVNGGVGTVKIRLNGQVLVEVGALGGAQANSAIIDFLLQRTSATTAVLTSGVIRYNSPDLGTTYLEETVISGLSFGGSQAFDVRGSASSEGGVFLKRAGGEY